MPRSLTLSKSGNTITAIIDGGNPIYGLSPRDIRPIYNVDTDTVSTDITAKPVPIENLIINGVTITDQDLFNSSIHSFFTGTGGGGAPSASTVLVVSTIADIALSTSATINLINVKDPIRGGIFERYTGASPRR